MNIVLIGYRGSGKTTVGRRLAERLKLSFVDVDDEVCDRFGMGTIKEFWDTHGEATFRELEAIVTVELLGRDQQVISLGGGTVLSDEARHAIIQARDTVRVYLRCDPQVLSQRIASDPSRQGTRPSSLDAAASSIERVRGSLIRREPYYERSADHVLEVTKLAPEEAAAYIIEHWLDS
jgi:shikimate kinase